ncbi:hypothetical protein JK636_04855 [Clostridium sp. YIM B02515]|uniref:Uncharacterized protein n=1 Tax=Clostridium rhizosphaerae TaxID=2803861 RepID=A0ABS1T6W9_9CLOT|nr:hypothetical protein [Clostridium rhizosphaerae]MBL4935085.1 hypothetical protein [Clostridium rhizosphaerae]
MKIVIIPDIRVITLEHCLECQRAHLDIYVDEGCVITVKKADSCKNLKN